MWSWFIRSSPVYGDEIIYPQIFSLLKSRINQGETFQPNEATEAFFAMTKLFQNKDVCCHASLRNCSLSFMWAFFSHFNFIILCAIIAWGICDRRRGRTQQLSKNPLLTQCGWEIRSQCLTVAFCRARCARWSTSRSRRCRRSLKMSLS